MLPAPPSIFAQTVLIFMYFITTLIPFLLVSRLIAHYIGIPSDVALFGFVFILIIAARWLTVSVRNI
jgi:hypothetical protein